jgi:hypothetical protein
MFRLLTRDEQYGGFGIGMIITGLVFCRWWKQSDRTVQEECLFVALEVRGEEGTLAEGTLVARLFTKSCPTGLTIPFTVTTTSQKTS